MSQKTETPKTKMKIFDYIFESSIKSSKTIIGLATEIVTLFEEINDLRVSVINLAKVVQVHQNTLDDICNALEKAAAMKKDDIGFPSTNNTKKDKPN